MLSKVNHNPGLMRVLRNMSFILETTLTCPSRSATKIEAMPTNACEYFYECTECNMLLKPKLGDCCVSCSYGTVSCPPAQEGAGEDCCRYQPLTKA